MFCIYFYLGDFLKCQVLLKVSCLHLKQNVNVKLHFKLIWVKSQNPINVKAEKLKENQVFISCCKCHILQNIGFLWIINVFSCISPAGRTTF